MTIGMKKDTLVGHMKSHDHVSNMLSYREKEATLAVLGLEAQKMDTYLKVSSALLDLLCSICSVRSALLRKVCSARSSLLGLLC